MRHLTEKTKKLLSELKESGPKEDLIQNLR